MQRRLLYTATFPRNRTWHGADLGQTRILERKIIIIMHIVRVGLSVDFVPTGEGARKRNFVLLHRRFGEHASKQLCTIIMRLDGGFECFDIDPRSGRRQFMQADVWWTLIRRGNIMIACIDGGGNFTHTFLMMWS